MENKDLFGRNLGFVRGSNFLPKELQMILNHYMPWTREIDNP
jgi:hypothetical protein